MDWKDHNKNSKLGNKFTVMCQVHFSHFEWELSECFTACFVFVFVFSLLAFYVFDFGGGGGLFCFYYLKVGSLLILLKKARLSPTNK